MYPPFLNNNDEMSIGHELKLDQLDQLSFQFSRLLNHLQWQRRMLQSDAKKKEGEDWDFCFIVNVKRLLSQFPIMVFDRMMRKEGEVLWSDIQSLTTSALELVWVIFNHPHKRSLMKVSLQCESHLYLAYLIRTSHLESSGAIAFHDGNKTMNSGNWHWHSLRVWFLFINNCWLPYLLDLQTDVSH